MTDNILEVMDTLSDRMIALQTRINQAYSDLCDYTLSQCVINLTKLNVCLEDFILMVSDLELSEDDAKMCTQTIIDAASTLKMQSQEIQSLVDELQTIV